MIHADNIIRQYGGDPADLLRFDDPGPELLPYATLTAARAPSSDLSALTGVYEWQGKPLILMVDGTLLGDDPERLDRIRHLVAMRGDAPYLAVLQPGRMTFYTIGLGGKAARSRVELSEAEADLRAIIPHLGNEQPNLHLNRRWISEVILGLLTTSLDTLVKAPLGLPDGDAISLVGRALFVRFLADRRLVPPEVEAMAEGGISALFDSASSTIAVSKWLDDTFNGDFLPLSAGTIETLPKGAFKITGDILCRSEEGQLHLNWKESWAKLDFAHIPVGVLSQAYERYLSHHERAKQRREGSFYTPRHIAELMVRASFAALRREGAAHKTRILDPAAGAGVFLITGFRQLVAERWREDDQPPDTKVLREILYKQITGFDINDSALRFAALGLYLMAIELDPSPEPVQKLGFKENFCSTVLRKLGSSADEDRPEDLGSLGDEVGDEHVGRYDLIIGNPPWSSATGLKDWPSVERTVLRIARARLGNDKAAAPLPNAVLDLPFVWRAMEWGRPNAQIAFALHARLLFQRGEGMTDARNALFGSLDVTGVINGSEVRQSKVWPGISAPFCLLFARNATPPAGAGFRFVSPHLEGPLTDNGGWRIDTSNSQLVSSQEIRGRPELLKVLFRGTRLDLELLDKVIARNLPTLGAYWICRFRGSKKQPRCSGNGYKLLHKGSKKNRNDHDQLGYSASELFDLPVLEMTDFPSILLDTSKLPLFRSLDIPRLDRVRDRSIYRGPLLLVHKSPPCANGRIQTAVATTDLAFNETFYGYSAREHQAPQDLACYLALLLGSKVALWHILVTSGEFGFERDVVEKFVIQEIPVPPFEELSALDRSRAAALFSELAEQQSEAGWQEVDRWVGGLFGLTHDDVQTISDTLCYRLPFKSNRDVAQRPASTAQLDTFRGSLESELQPWFERFGRTFTVKTIAAPSLSPWRFVYIGKGDLDAADDALRDDWSAAIQLSDKLAVTEILYVDEARECLILGRLNQARYWSISQARLAARRIVWEQVDFLSRPSATRSQ